MEGSCSSDVLSRISLRPLGVSDIDDFMVWASDEKVARFCIWEAYTNKEVGMKFIKEHVVPHPSFRAICLDNKPVGAISVCPKSGNDSCRGELSYVLGSKYWGKGIGTRAVKIVADAIFKEWAHCERLEALVDVQNVGSQRILEKAGFKKEGVLRKYLVLKGRTCDMMMYSLVPSDQCQT